MGDVASVGLEEVGPGKTFLRKFYVGTVQN